MIVQSKALPLTNLSTLVNFNCGGGVVSEVLINRMNQYLPKGVFVAYGMTELAGIITSNSLKPRLGSVGHLVNGTTVAIIDAEGKRCGIGKDGEICFLMQHPFLGYFGDAAGSAAHVDNEGWLHSGDIGHFDEDGYLFVVDRLTEMLAYKGFQISPAQIESVILKVPGVKLVSVVGIPDEVCTNLLAAMVLRNSDVSVSELEIMETVKRMDT